jgi:hypothetical protein
MVHDDWQKRKRDRRLRKIGGRLDSSWQPELSAWVIYLRNGLEELVASASTHLRNRKIELVITPDGEPNASAGMLDNNTYYIAITIGLILQLTSECSLVSSSRKLWEGCRFSSDEYVRKAMLNDEFRRRLEGVRLLSASKERFIQTLASERQKQFLPALTGAVIAEMLSTFAIHLVVRHELAHILAGHVDYVISSRLSMNLAENSKKKHFAVSSSAYFLEMDADLGAALMIPDWTKIFATQAYHTANEYYRCLAFSACALFLALGENSVQSHYDRRSHPFAFWRFRFFMGTLNTRFEGTNSDVLCDTIITQTMWAWAEFGLVRNDLFNTWLSVLAEDPDGAFFKTLREQEGRKILKELEPIASRIIT